MMTVLDTPFILVMGILTSVSVRANSARENSLAQITRLSGIRGLSYGSSSRSRV
ncbi:MAG: hypothetical protein WCJ72_15440 [Chryseobacterium sp.]